RPLLGRIDEILAISRIEAGTLTFSLEPVNLDAALTDALALVQPLAAVRGIELTTAFADGDPTSLLADRQRLRQVLLNLLSNAVKYNRDRGTVRVAYELVGERVRPTVTDPGPGIPTASLLRLFSPFDRLGAERTDIQGTGLGLALSKSLVEQMGGQITVEAAYGTGSIFAVELDVAADPVGQATAVPALLSGDQDWTTPRKLL